MAQSLVLLGRSDEAQQTLETVVEERRDAETWATLSRLAQSDGRLNEAWALMERAVAL